MTGSPSKTRTCDLVVNPACGGTLPTELLWIGDESADSTFFDLLFTGHGAGTGGVCLAPYQHPRPFKTFCRLGENVLGIIMLADPPLYIARGATVEAPGRFALNDVDPIQKATPSGG